MSIAKADFKIISKPAYIEFDCPHCGNKNNYSWSAVNPATHWGDKWPNIICQECGELVGLGDYEYD